MNLYNTYKHTIDNSINISYKGNITFKFVDCVLEVLLNRLEEGEQDIKTRLRVFRVLTECLQNLCNYVETGGIPPVKENSVFFLLSTLDKHYSIITGNYVRNYSVEKFQKRLNFLKKCSEDELKEEYIRVLMNDSFTEKGGGGLGFIDIARKTNQQFNFEFTQVNDQFTFFEFSLIIPRN